MVDGSTQTVGTSIINVAFPLRTTTVSLRAPSTNTANVTVRFNRENVVANGGTILRAGESLSFDRTQLVQLRALLNENINDSDFFRNIVMISSAISQTVYVDYDNL